MKRCEVGRRKKKKRKGLNCARKTEEKKRRKNRRKLEGCTHGRLKRERKILKEEKKK